VDCADAHRLSGAIPLFAEHLRVDVDGSPVQVVPALLIIEMTPTPYAPIVWSDSRMPNIATGPPLSPLPEDGVPELWVDHRVQ